MSEEEVREMILAALEKFVEQLIAVSETNEGQSVSARDLRVALDIYGL